MRATTASFLLVTTTALGFAAACADAPPGPDAGAFVSPSAAASADEADPPQTWPHVFEEGGLRIAFYEPQVEAWDHAQLLARAAVSVETAASPEPHFGTVWIAAHTHVHKEDHLVVLQHPEIARASFPTAPEGSGEWVAALRKHLPEIRVLELDRLEASLAATRAATAAPRLALGNEPPQIIFATRPSLLVLIDGPPVQRRDPRTPLLRVVNTRALLLVKEDGAPTYFLGIDGRWLAAPALEGPWTLAESAPEGAETARKLATDAKLVDLHENDPEILKLLEKGEVPRIHVSTRPAELIVTNGEPELVPIPGTKLEWAKNTDADIFLDTSTGTSYVLVGGRWFRAASRSGPWSFVATGELPSDFARIPVTDPAGEVLASVPGTPQAQEAVIVNGIPQTEEINRREAKLQVVYDGEPQFRPISGTSLTYAVNTATPVIRVSDRYFACEDGVWFTSSSPAGPWVVADAVPGPIYEIPPSCPIYYVTYCRVYEAEPDWVCFGYTPGYFGCYVADGCVVWGTGFWWRPWIGSYWYGCPWTYGFGVGIRWGFGWGWSVGFGLGGGPFCAPWWGPLGRPHPAFYPLARGDAVFHLNARNANIYRAWPGGVVRPREPYVARGRASTARPNNVYSGSDGRVYRQTERGWETREGGAWRPSPSHLENERQAREQGATRSMERRQPSAPPPRVYQPMQPQHEPFSAEPRPEPRPIPFGLRGGSGGGRGGTRGSHR